MRTSNIERRTLNFEEGIYRSADRRIGIRGGEVRWRSPPSLRPNAAMDAPVSIKIPVKMLPEYEPRISLPDHGWKKGTRECGGRIRNTFKSELLVRKNTVLFLTN